VGCIYRFFVSHRAELCKPLDLLDFLSISVVLCWVVLAYTWVGYPLILILVTHGSLPHETSRGKNQSVDTEFSPTVTVLVAAHNEEKHIGARIKNLIELDYPENKITVRIGVDGSSDRTADIARQWVSKRLDIRVYEVAERRGKIATLKDLISRSKEDILILTDANTVFKTDALQKLVSHFVDPCIGCVCGRVQLLGEGEENVYWRMETHLKMMESSLDSCLGANGAIYAIKRSLFWTDIPDNTIVDDFVIGMKVREQGLRVVYEPEAVGQENLPPTVDEWVRRKRIGAGDYQALFLCKKCLLPTYGKFAWVFWSHKVLRWFTPHILLALFILTFAIFAIRLSLGVENCFAIELKFIFTPVLMMVSIFGALTARFLRNFPSLNGKLLKLLNLSDHFITMQVALFLGFLRFCRGNLRGHWERTPRN